MTSALTGVVERALQELGYSSRFLKRDWHLSLAEFPQDASTVPLIAFWGEPFDQFRSAVSVIDRNGVPDHDLAVATAQKYWSHVAICGQDDVSLWFLDGEDVRSLVEHVPREAIGDAFRRFGSELGRVNVARHKLRLRQYALYEIDPTGKAFAEWAIRPSADRVVDIISQVLRRSFAAAEVGSHDSAASSGDVVAMSRLALRVFALKIAMDCGWSASQGLGAEDVSSFFQRAQEYPVRWVPDSSNASWNLRAEALTESLLRQVRFYDFSGIDAALIVRSLSEPVVSPLKAALDLFPTPKSLAWDMMSVFPLSQDAPLCDPTCGTGTFLIAAGHALWGSQGPDAQIGDILRDLLAGGDASELASDITHISLDLAFGQTDAGWNVHAVPADQSLQRLDRTRQWSLAGNLPWSGKSRGENDAAAILRSYLKFVQGQRVGWVATVVPKSIWTSRGRYGGALRAEVARDFEVEHVWELGWDAISGGRAESVASILSRRASSDPVGGRGVVIWKRKDTNGSLRTIGYRRSWLPSDLEARFQGPDAVYLAERLKGSATLASVCDLVIGLQPKHKSAPDALSGEPEGAGRVPFALDSAIFGGADTPGQRWNYWLPESTLVDDAQFNIIFQRPAREYRGRYRELAQIILPEAIYEGMHRLKVGLLGRRALFSNRFIVCIRKHETDESLIPGVAIALNSILGRVWLYLFASAGRHIAKKDVEGFPLPPGDGLARLARAVDVRSRLGGMYVLPFDTEGPTDLDLEVFQAYGLTPGEVAAMIGIGSILGLSRRPSKDLIRDWDEIPAMSERDVRDFQLLAVKEPAELSEAELARGLELWGEALTVTDSQRDLILRGTDAEISLRKSLMFYD